MKLRRVLVAAAATTAIAPLALVSAPAVFADDAPSTDTNTSIVTTAPETTPESTPPTTEPESTPPTSAPATSDTAITPGTAAPASQTAGNPTGSTPTQSAPASTPPASATPSTEPSEPADLCTDEDGNDTTQLSADLRSGLSGLPETIVAGSGWKAFSFNVSNHGDNEIKDIKPLIGVAAEGWDGKDYSGKIAVEVFDSASGTWHTVADAAGEGGTFPAFSLGAGQSTSFKLRLSVSGKVPDAIGVTGGFAQYSDAEGCWMADDPKGWIYFFDILAAGSDAGHPNEAKPQTGGSLTEVSEVDATGSLAETGSSSALPMIALVGGIAVVAGGGAVFAVRRRKTGGQAA
ncbi:LAETG motif-containing sortase-dependent surface protein [Streptomyces sp. NPDC003857]